MAAYLAAPSLFRRLAEGARQHALERNSGRLADMFLAPDSATRIGALAARGAASPLAEMFARAGAQGYVER